MRRRLLILLLVCALSWSAAQPSAQQIAQQIVDAREPFALEIPEINSGLHTAMDVTFPTDRLITRLKLWVVTPYAERISYGHISAKLNDVSLGPVAKPRAGLHGTFLDIDLRLQPTIKLLNGKNRIEILAQEDRTGKTYRCSFVLLPGKVNAAATPEAPDTTIRCSEALAPADPHAPVSDHQAPQINLAEPQAALHGTDAPLRVRVRGDATDNSGAVASVTVNGQLIAPPQLSKTEQKAKEQAAKEQAKQDKKTNQPAVDPATIKLPFDQTVTVEAQARVVLIEAADRVGNRRLCSVPILRAPVAKREGFGGRRYAVIIGVSQYLYSEGGLSNLSFADKDAEALRDFLKTPAGGGFKQEEIVCLTNRQATQLAVKAEVTRFLTNATENDLIYLFLAGHGAPDKYDPQKLYFLLHDTKVADLPGTALSMRWLGEFLDRQTKRARVIAFFDTCHSAGINRQALSAAPPAAPVKPGGPDKRGVGTKKDKQSAPPANQPPTVTLSVGAPATSPAAQPGFNFYEGALFQKKGWTVISSSGLNEESQEGARWRDAAGNGHGVFTWALLEGAQQGKADANGDCRITAGELFDYIRKTVSGATGGAQNPQALPGGNGDLAIATAPCQKPTRP
ncbi:MAG: caspase family protein [Acidobacteria bacterium]|nr:caspase family protein [Acidobacteriota bacterium]MBI3421813.1 caspase family protein [Acidobacteriota bacterium]